MNDNMLNSLLIEAGVTPIKEQTEHVAGWGAVKGLKLDSHTFKAKKQKKGVLWPSVLNHYSDIIESFMMETLTSRKLTSSEYYEHFLPQVQGLLTWGRENGYLLPEDEIPFSAATTRAGVALREAGEDAPLTPGLLLHDFVNEVSRISREIKAVINLLVSRMVEGGSQHDFAKESDRWVIDFARRNKQNGNVLTKEEDDYIAGLLAEKERIMAYYKGQADRFTAGTSKLSDAFAFVLLWQEIMSEQSLRTKKADARRLLEAIADYESQYGVSPHHVPGALEELKRSLPKSQYSKLSSVLTLFPTGALQFLSVMDKGSATQFVKAPRHISGFFSHPDLTDTVRQQVKHLEGKKVILKDGHILGTGLFFATEDYNQTGIVSNVPIHRIIQEGYSKEIINKISGVTYTKGGQAFTGGYQLATLVYVETTSQSGKPFQSGIRLWLQNLQHLTDEQTNHLGLTQVAPAPEFKMETIEETPATDWVNHEPPVDYLNDTWEYDTGY